MSHCKALLDFVAHGSHKHAEQKHKEEREAGKSTVKMTEKKKCTKYAGIFACGSYFLLCFVCFKNVHLNCLPSIVKNMPKKQGVHFLLMISRIKVLYRKGVKQYNHKQIRCINCKDIYSTHKTPNLIRPLWACFLLFIALRSYLHKYRVGVRLGQRKIVSLPTEKTLCRWKTGWYFQTRGFSHTVPIEIN